MLTLDGAPRPLGPRAALAAAIIVGVGTALLVWLTMAVEPTFVPDIDHVWYAARALLEGRNPYAEIGLGRAFEWGWPLYFPLPAVVLLLPLAPFPVEVARVVVATIPGAALAYVLARRDARWLTVFLAAPYIQNVIYVQWTVLLTGALVHPVFALSLPAKPSIGVAIAAGFPSRRAFVIASCTALVPVVLSFVLWPGWFPVWREALVGGAHSPMVVLPFGFVLLLAALRWRDWRARLLLVLSLVPQTTTTMSAFPLLMLPRTWHALIALAMLSYLPALAIHHVGPVQEALAAAETFAAAMRVDGILTLWSMYLPALAMVLWPRRAQPADPRASALSATAPAPTAA